MSDEQPQRPASDADHEEWKAYWAALDMPWRTEPEIEEQRRAYLAERRAVKPDAEKGMYPFRDENGSIRLTRADVEWLVATHDAGAPVASPDGPVLWRVAKPDGSVWTRYGPDLRGADLRRLDLSHLPSEDARFNSVLLTAARLDGAYLSGADLSETDCMGAMLREAHLESADLGNAKLQHADLSGAHLFQASLMNADLHGANLRGADLTWAYLVNADLAGAELTGAHLTEAYVAGGRLDSIHLDAHTAADLLGAIVAGGHNYHIPQRIMPHMDWTTLPFASIEWTAVFRVAEQGIQYWQDVIAGRLDTYVPPSTSPEAELVKAHRLVARSYQRVATVWQEQGLDEYADQLRRRAEELRQEVVRRGEDPDVADRIEGAESDGEGDISF